jgi:hypothetical protein
MVYQALTNFWSADQVCDLNRQLTAYLNTIQAAAAYRGISNAAPIERRTVGTTG